MNFFEVVILGLVGYNLIKDSFIHDNNLGQLPEFNTDNPVNPEIRSMIQSIIEQAFDNTFAKMRNSPVVFNWPSLPELGLLESQAAKPSPDHQTIEASKWLRLVQHPSIVIILGKRGSGKSVLGYRLLELLRWAASPYVIGLPKEARKYLPDWIGMSATLEDVPPKSIVLIDEAYIPYHARSSMATEAKTMSQCM